MCSVCHKIPCDSRCPNAPDPVAVYTCKYCGEDIVEGDEYVMIDDDYYHDECFMDCAAGILLEQFGAVKGVAEVDDGYDG